MAELRTQLTTQMSNAMSGGEDEVVGTGQKWQVVFTGADPGDTITLYLTDSISAEQVVIGAGDASQSTPIYCKTHRGKVYLLSETKTLFSGENQPTVFNDPEGNGNGFVDMSNQTDNPEDLLAVTSFQGRLAFFARHNVQLWQVATDPAAWAFTQVLENIGTILEAKETVQSRGDIDVLFLSDTGVRSLRSKVDTLNAYVDDVGSPIDSLIKDDVRELFAGGDSLLIPSCAIVEPSSSRYLLFLNGKIYVLSTFPNSKVMAWSMYEPKDSAGETFRPSKFFIYKGQVYAVDFRSTPKLYRYGGANDETYDSCAVTVESPWLNLRNPNLEKSAEGIQAAFSGSWTIETGMDPRGDLVTVYGPQTDYTFDKGMITMSGVGTHFKFKATSEAAGPAVFSSLSFLYKGGDKV